LVALLLARLSALRTLDPHPDIAHRNDIDPGLKREIKTQLQNKLHRCAGPEDLATSAGLLQRITAPGTNYSPAFVEQFKIFHQDSRSSSMPGPWIDRLAALAPLVDTRQAELMALFQRQKAGSGLTDQLAALGTLTTLRQAFLENMTRKAAFQKHELLLADIALKNLGSCS